MTENTISKDKIYNAMDLMAMMVVEEVESRFDESENQLLVSFMNSIQGRMLYDDSTKLWWCGPSEIAANYEKERQNCGDKRVVG